MSEHPSSTVSSKCSNFWKILTRKKVLNFDEDEDKLGRILGTLDLTALGVGATLGVGVYVIAGHVARDQAGPSVIISFLIAAIASFLAGLCYAEFGARAPKSGSAYTYTYICLGELMAFIVGWNLMLEYIIGSASVSKGMSLYLDSLINNTMRQKFEEIAPISWTFLGNYFDFFAFVVPLLFGTFGLKKSTMVNNGLTILNLAIVLIVVIAGAFKTDVYNWRIPGSSDQPEIGNGGFFPFGFKGTLEGAATCFFGYVGFDCIATTSEEVRNPRKSIPKAILLSLTVIFISYFAVSTVLTLMIPYYLQDIDAPLVYAFGEVGWLWAKTMVAVGGILALLTSLFGAMFPQSRILYAMAEDGLIFKIFGKISRKFLTPIYGTIFSALLTGIFGGIFDINALVKMLSIGTLMAYTMVAISVLILRYTDVKTENTESTSLVNSKRRITCLDFFAQLFHISKRQSPSAVSRFVVVILTIFYCLFCIAISLIIQYTSNATNKGQIRSIALTAVSSVLLVIIVLLITIQPKEQSYSPFKVPLVPLLPCISIFINIFLMLMLDSYTWIRFGIWMVIGIPMYIACACFKQKNAKHSLDIIALDDKKHESTFGHYNQAFKSSTDELTLTNNNNIESVKLNGSALKLIPVVLVNEAEESFNINENIAQSTPKSKPPSPNRMFDEILLISEVGNSVKEKKEANGNVYFIDTVTNQQMDSLTESHKAIQILDNILNDEEVIMGKRVSESSAVFVEQSTMADIHREDSLVIAEKSSFEILSNEELLEIRKIVDEIIENAQMYATIQKNMKIDKFENETEIEIDDNEMRFEQAGENEERLEIDEDKNKQIMEAEIRSEIDKENFDKFDELKVRRLDIEETSLETEEGSTIDSKKSEGDIKENDNEMQIEIVGTTLGESTDTEKITQKDESSQKVTERAAFVVGQTNAETRDELDETESQTFGTLRRRKEFMDKLSTLLLGSSRVKQPEKLDPVTEGKHDKEVLHLEPMYRRSKSEPSFAQLLANFKNASQENQEIVNTPPPPPKFDPVLYNSIGRIKSKANSKADTNDDDPNIPKPPTFDPVVYNTLGKTKYRENLTNVQPKKVRPPLEMPDNDESEEEEPSNPREAFKHKLERLLRRGPSIDKSHPIEPIIKLSPQITEEQPTEPTQKPSSNTNSVKDAGKSFNTVQKQKLIFENVLKEIKSETKPSLIKSSHKNRLSLSEIRNGLRAVERNEIL